MHDVDRNSILYKDWEKKKHKHKAHSGTQPEPGHHHDRHDHGHDHGHRLNPADHDHAHPDTAYEDHSQDEHEHHEGRFSRDRVFTHLHEHKHVFYHAHHHTHDPNQQTLVHKVFKDPVRDWFGLGVMVLMILAGYFRWLPGHLSSGILVCAAVIGIFPALKNAFFISILKRRPTLELAVSGLLIAGLFTGLFFEVALCSMFLLMGSFMRLDFSWKTR